MAFSTTSFFEVQGLAMCPMAQRGDHSCSDDGGRWFPIYFLNTKTEAMGALAHVLESDSRIYDPYEDFRLATPIEKRLQRRLERGGYPWETGRKREVRTALDDPTEGHSVVKRGNRKRVKR